MSAISPRFAQAVPLGVVRTGESGLTTHLNASGETIYRPGDRLVLMARDHEEATPQEAVCLSA